MAILFTPCSASFSAIPRPIPRDAPVIRAVCCVSVIGMTPSRSRVRIDRIDLDLVYYTLHLSMGKTRPRAAAGNVGGDDEFSDGRQSPILHAMSRRPAEHYSHNRSENLERRRNSASKTLRSEAISPETSGGCRTWQQSAKPGTIVA